jgi:hypothetical protein
MDASVGYESTFQGGMNRVPLQSYEVVPTSAVVAEIRFSGLTTLATRVLAPRNNTLSMIGFRCRPKASAQG